MNANLDTAIRLAAFRWLGEATAIHGDVLQRNRARPSLSVDDRIVAHIRSRDHADIQSLLDSKVALEALFSSSSRLGTLRLILVDPES